jgi:L-cysteine S-thiosulfotransferase
MKRLAVAMLAGAWAAVHAQPGDAARGQALVAQRQASQCLLCHSAPLADAHTHGNLGPPLAGVGQRLSEAELRERLENPQRFNAATIMPSYGRASMAERVAPAHQGKPIFTPEQLADVVAYLASLK